MGDQFGNEEKAPLQLSYHRHAYGLGEHYNSVVVSYSGEATEDVENTSGAGENETPES